MYAKDHLGSLTPLSGSHSPSQMLRRPKGSIKLSALRGGFSFVCALALLLVTLAHSTHHAPQVSLGGPSVMAAFTQSDAGGEPAGEPSSLIEHCHGCTMTAVTVADGAQTSEAVSTAVAMWAPPAHLVFVPPAVNPPPIAAL